MRMPASIPLVRGIEPARGGFDSLAPRSSSARAVATFCHAPGQPRTRSRREIRSSRTTGIGAESVLAQRDRRGAHRQRRQALRIRELPYLAGLVSLRPCPGATPLRHHAFEHDAADQLSPATVERAVLVGRRQEDVALGVVLGPHAGLLVVGELPGHGGLAIAVLDVAAGDLAVLVDRLGRDLAVDELAQRAVELAALPALVERRHAVGGPLLPRAVAQVVAVMALDDDLALARQLLVQPVGGALVHVLARRHLLVGPERQHRAGAALDLEPAELVLVVIVEDELAVGLALVVAAGEHDLVLVPLGPRAIALAVDVVALALLVAVAIAPRPP